MSGFYQKPSVELIYDLINRDNPDLPYKVSADNFEVYGLPQVMVPANNNNRNTRIVMRGIPGKGYRGLVTFNYNRIDFAQLFKDIDVTVTHYTANTFALILPTFNAVYGLALTAAEMANPSWSIGTNTTTVTVTTAGVASTTSSLAFIGTIPKFVWLRGGKTLDTIITKTETTMPTIIAPTGNLVSMDFVYRGMDFSALKTQIINVNSSPNSTTWPALATGLKNITGDNWLYNNSSQLFNLYNASLALYTGLPVPAVDGANFNYVDTNAVARIALSSLCTGKTELGSTLGAYLYLPFNQ